MGQVAIEALERELAKANGHVPATRLRVFLDALRLYLEASDNVRRHGAVVAHPRTGAPIENPYLAIQTRQGALLAKLGNIKADGVIAAINAELAEKAAALARPPPRPGEEIADAVRAEAEAARRRRGKR